jgi:hypothetical protein
MPLGERLFTFGVVADTHVNQEEDRASSDFAVNRLANARNRYAFQALAARRPEFVLHLGDIVHPTPGHPAYAQAAARYRELAGAFDCPVHLTPGNHDVGDKPGDWLPVASVNDDYLAAYRREFGANYHAFDHGDCHFVVMDAQLVNSGLADEEAQRKWLEADLESRRAARTFLCMHYPPYLLDPAEAGHYDNLDEPGRSWLLALLAEHRVEAVFAGHVHNFWYHRFADTDIYLLPSTAFVRMDYSEMYRVEPGPERGRDDAPKLGFLVVDVHENGHVAHPVRTGGERLAPGEAPARSRSLSPVHVRSITRSPIGVDLRHPWAEVVEVAASGAMDEFARKPARNDWPLLALWEMGIRRLRVPLSDLASAATRTRMLQLARQGHAFTVYTHGVPGAQGVALLREHAGLLEAWEVIAPLAGLAPLAERIARLRESVSLSVHLSRLRRPGDALHHGDRARHVIEHGFLAVEGERMGEALGAVAGLREAFDGVVFRVPRGSDLSEQFARIASMAEGLALAARAYVRLADDNPARARDDDLANANRVAEALLAASVFPRVAAWLDTFDDVDRGYFPRTGLVDRRFNPRPAGRVCRHLNGALSATTDLQPGEIHVDAVPGARVLRARSGGGEALWLVLPAGPGRAHWFPGFPAPGAGWERVDLLSGKIEAFAGAFDCPGPVLVGRAFGAR